MKMENECNKWKKDRAYNYLRKITEEVKNDNNFLQKLDSIFNNSLDKIEYIYICFNDDWKTIIKTDFYLGDMMKIL